MVTGLLRQFYKIVTKISIIFKLQNRTGENMYNGRHPICPFYIHAEIFFDLQYQIKVRCIQELFYG